MKQKINDVLRSFSFFPFGLWYEGEESLKEKLDHIRRRNGFEKDQEKIGQYWQNVGNYIWKALEDEKSNHVRF